MDASGYNETLAGDSGFLVESFCLGWLMPIYVYQVIETDGAEGEVFEIMQRMSEEPLTTHPENGKPVRRILSAPNTMRKFGPANMSNENLSRLGFTKYQKAGDGHYEKKAGSGPDVIKG